MMSNTIPELNHTAAVITFIGASLLVIGAAVRIKATSLDLKKPR
ncbi:MAG: hypothetical protein P0Y55_09880 [Candidatus Cohnella colombiensis]|uniref:Uncharacterized protein n=1 Tax=Candidatus Cohnella colombiensis TaxID=3121368 RepID=A0AA95JES0_9BACL|nr:MAG: hypothetical protein P0Y55_09880 [Cohnella sp.]